jgi:HK97 family phage prohead protease
MHVRDWEVAANHGGLEYGGGGYIAAIDGHKLTGTQTKARANAAEFILQGYALRWNSLVHLDDGKYMWFARHAIRDPMKGPIKRFQFDHDDNRVIGNTKSGLVLVADDYGLAMRFYPREGDDVHLEAIETVQKNGRTALSVGVTSYTTETETFQGQPVHIVRDATLHEVSLVAAGACKEAYCVALEKADCGPLLSDDVASKRLLADGGAANFMRALRRLEATYRH